VVEKSGVAGLLPATDSVVQPCDFPLGSRKSRAAARVLLEQRKKPSHPPDFTLDLSSASLERCQEIYAKLASRPPRAPLRAGVPYMVIRFPDGFTPTDPANTNRSGTQPI
jgi:hypothetical protein